jgi:putative SOS response-associated peptidase YedK
MCGRFTIMLDADDLKESMGLSSVPDDWRPRFNIAPTQAVAVVADAQLRQAEWMRWGLIPSWAKDMEIGNRLINARSETVTEKSSFRAAFSRRRCILLADGFYEWLRSADKKVPSIPYHFHRKDRKPFGFAGLWETWRNPAGEEIRSCTILTTSANEVVRPVHNRMPVLLDGADLWNWILPAMPEQHLALLKPYPDDALESHIVSRMVNTPARDIPECAYPLVD